MRVIIIGAGIAGLSTAIALLQVGIEVSVHERAPLLREVGAGISLWTNALIALESLGALEIIRNRSLEMTRSEIRCGAGRWVMMQYQADELKKLIGTSMEVVRMIHRADLVDALGSLVPSEILYFGKTSVRYEQDANGVRAYFEDGSTAEGDLLIGADGIHSIVRNQLIGDEQPRYAGYTCWRGLCRRPASIEAGYAGEWWGRGQRIGITTIPNDHVYWWAAHNSSPAESSDDEKSACLKAFADWCEPVPQLIKTATSVIRNDIIDRPPTRKWYDDRICLIGDAAHPTTPNLGQGGCLAIEDAVVLARQLAKHSNHTEAYAGFVSQRFDRAAAITNDSWQMGRVGHMSSSLGCKIRDKILALTGRILGPKLFIKHVKYRVDQDQS